MIGLAFSLMIQVTLLMVRLAIIAVHLIIVGSIALAAAIARALEARR